MRDFGQYIASRREQLGLSQEQVGKIVGLTKAGISKIESGQTKNIKMKTFMGLSKALRVPPPDLIQIYQKEAIELEGLDNIPIDKIAIRKAILELLKASFSPAEFIQLFQDVQKEMEKKKNA